MLPFRKICPVVSETIIAILLYLFLISSTFLSFLSISFPPLIHCTIILSTVLPLTPSSQNSSVTSILPHLYPFHTFISFHFFPPYSSLYLSIAVYKETRNVFHILVGTSLGKPVHRWQSNIKLTLRKCMRMRFSWCRLQTLLSSAINAIQLIDRNLSTTLHTTRTQRTVSFKGK